MDELRPTLVKRGATIGANATLVCGITVGEYSLVGAGSVLTKDVPAFALMVGNPAKRIGWVCRCGETLPKNLKCRACGKKYKRTASTISEA
jgi:UDP-2-acetamido-3-amino-2,3-dideoxy-glucuronate N-acetyltransferase